MKKERTSTNLSPDCKLLLRALSTRLGISQAGVMEQAVRKMAMAQKVTLAQAKELEQEIEPMKSVHIRTVPGQTVYEAIADAIADGNLPTGATLGPKELRGVGKQFIEPDQEILGTVNVRPHEDFYIVRRVPSAAG